MNIYDFDKTIYKKNSITQFYLFCLKKQFGLIRYIFKQLWALGMYLLGIWSRQTAREKFFCFLKGIKNIDQRVTEFWQVEGKNINKNIIKDKTPDDVIVTASPEFLIKPMAQMLELKLIASHVDKNTGLYDGNECYGIEKVVRLRSIGINNATNAYSDNLKDVPMLKLATNSYIVDKGEAIRITKYKPSFMKKVFDYFFSVEFFQFLVVGVINTLNSTLISTLFSIWIQANIAFIIGYILSLCIAYVLNSIWIFKQKMKFKKLVMFAVSYIPNFIIQNVIVLLLYNLLGLNKILVYALAAIIGIPVTFVCVKLLCFLKKKPKESNESKT